jgi:hypothetical protein
VKTVRLTLFKALADSSLAVFRYRKALLLGICREKRKHKLAVASI